MTPDNALQISAQAGMPPQAGGCSEPQSNCLPEHSALHQYRRSLESRLAQLRLVGQVASRLAGKRLQKRLGRGGFAQVLQLRKPTQKSVQLRLQALRLGSQRT